LLAAFLGGCCLEVSGSSSDPSTATGSTGGGGSSGSSGSTTGFEDGGPITGTLWIGGVGALDTRGVPRTGNVPFDETCPYPPSAPVGVLAGPCAIDGAGDLWAHDWNDPSGALYVWTPDQLAQSCASAAPTITLFVRSFLGIAFDPDGNLWGANAYVLGGGVILGYPSENLKTSGSPSAAWLLIGECGAPNALCGTDCLAFDADGYLWVGGTGLQAFSPSTRTGLNDGGLDGTGPLADLYLTTSCGDGGTDCVDNFLNLAFDTAGTLWAWTTVSTGSSPGVYHLMAYNRAQLQNASNDHVPQPVRDIVFSFPNQPYFAGALAFDADGDLWVGSIPVSDGGATTLFRLPRETLALDAGSHPTPAAPDVSINAPGPDWRNAPQGFSLAFSPIPPGLPIQP